MMHTCDFTEKLRTALKHYDTAAILPALMQDGTIWSALQDPQVLEKARDLVTGKQFDWCPATVSLAAAAVQFNFADADIHTGFVFEPVLQRQAVDYYERCLQTGKLPVHPAEMGLLAIALNELQRVDGSWEKSLSKLLATGQAHSHEGEMTLKTILASLYGFDPNSKGLLSYLSTAFATDKAVDVVAHIILSQPLTIDEQVQVFSPLVSGGSLAEQAAWIEKLLQSGRKSLASQLAAKIGMPGTSGTEPDAQILADVKLAGGDNRKAQPLLEDLRKDLKSRLAEVSLAVGEAAMFEHDEEKARSAYRDALHLSPFPSEIGYEVMLASGEGIDDLAKTTPIENAPPAIQVLFGEHWLADVDAYKAQASKAARTLAAQIGTDPKVILPAHLKQWNPMKLLSILDQHGLADEAIEVAKALLSWRPADNDLIKYLAETSYQAGDLAQALTYSDQLVMREPAAIDWKRRSAKIAAELGKWERSYNDWLDIMDDANAANAEDALNLARAALGAGQFKKAEETCKAVLEKNDENGMALAILGKAQAEQGNPEAAAQALSKATLLAPEESQPWIWLAELQRKEGNLTRSLETLRSAVMAVPHSAEINLEFAKACLENNLYSEAVPYLKEAARLSPESNRAVLELVQVLNTLGHLDEAQKAVESARQKWPMDPNLAYEHARTLAAAGQHEASLPIFEIALRAETIDPKWRVEYADAAIGEAFILADASSAVDGKLLFNVQHELENVLELDPENFKAKLMLAEVRRVNGDLVTAYKLYKEIIDQKGTLDEALGWRIHAGLGKTALDLNEVETALAALQEATQQNPAEPKLKQWLAEGFLKAGLGQDAQSMANQVLKSSSDNVDTLLWYSRLMEQLAADSEALGALNTAAQLAPDRADILTRLAHFQNAAGDKVASLKTVEQVNALDNAAASDLVDAAGEAYRAGDLQLAISCLEKAGKQQKGDTGAIKFKVACLYKQLEDNEAALAALQGAVAEAPSATYLYQCQADLMNELGRPQAAIASLEHATRVVDSKESSGIVKTITDNLREFLPSAWSNVIDRPAGIHAQYVALMSKTGDATTALYHAEQALMVEPDDLEMRYVAASLAMDLLQDQKAAALVEFTQHAEDFVGKSEVFVEQAAKLLALKIRLALQKNDLAQAEADYQQAAALAPDQPHVLLANAQLTCRQGHLAEAESSYRQALVGASQSAFSIEPDWLAETEMELMHWDEAITHFEAEYRQRPTSVLARLNLVKTFVRAMEHDRKSEQLKVMAHRANVDANHADLKVSAQQISNELVGVLQTPEVVRWKSRLQVVCQPSAQTIRDLGLSGRNPDDIAAVVAGCREIGNIEVAKKAAQRYPDDGEVATELALALIDTDTAEAVNVAAHAVEALPENPLCQATLALAADKVGDHQAAEQALESALEAWPEESEWHAWLAELAAKTGEREKALEHLEIAVSQQSSNRRYARALGEAYLANEQNQKSIEVLEDPKFLENPDVDTLLLLSKAYRLCGNFETSMHYAEQALDIDASSSEAALACGQILFDQGQLEKAEEFAQKAFEIDGNNSDAVMFLTLLKTQMAGNAAALEFLDKVVAEQKVGITAQLARAKLIENVCGVSEALPVYKQLANSDPEDDEVLATLAAALYTKGNYDEAAKNANQSLRNNPNQPRMHLLLGKYHGAIGQLDQALHHLGEVVRLDPANFEAYMELGKIYHGRRESAKALLAYEQAIQLAPNDFKPYYQSAIIMKEGKDFVGAEKMLRKASELAPNDLDIHRQLGAVIALNLVHNSMEVGTTL
jgi:tetratricopeptide (TPR) repeat protein